MTNEALFTIVSRLKTIMTIDAADKMREQIGSIVEELNASLMSSGACGNVCKIMRKIIKREEKGARPILGYTGIDSAGRQCALDGYILIRSNTVYDTLRIWDNAEEKFIDTDKIMSASTKDCDKPLVVPALNELKAFLADYKEKWSMEYNSKIGSHKVLYRIPSVDKRDDNPYVDITLLMEMVEAFPDAEMLYKNAISAIHVRSENGDGILLPINLNDPNAHGIEITNAYYEAKCKQLYAAEPSDSETDLQDAIKRIEAQEPITIEEFEALLDSKYIQALPV